MNKSTDAVPNVYTVPPNASSSFFALYLPGTILVPYLFGGRGRANACLAYLLYHPPGSIHLQQGELSMAYYP